jgi:hypothetical protein
MIRQQYDDDIDHIIEPKHMLKVWQAIESGHDKYFKLLLEKDPLQLKGRAALVTLKKSKKSKPGDDPASWVAAFKKAIEDFQPKADQYRTFFDPKAMDEYAHSRATFKPALGKDCPIIRHTLHSQSRELLEWRKKYNITKPAVLLDMFTALVDFHRKYAKNTKPASYAKFDKVDQFGFDPIEDDEDCRINGVIGMGIKSAVLHNLTPTFFPPRDRYSLLGFYLLTNYDAFGLPSDSSEFIMYDHDKQLPDGTNYGSHNYWYPYALFTLYSLRLYRRLKAAVAPLEVDLDDHYRFVYTMAFLHKVCDLEKDKIKTFVAYDVLNRFVAI